MIHGKNWIHTFLPEGDVTTFEFFKLETRAIPPARESGRISAGMIFLISADKKELSLFTCQQKYDSTR